MQQDFLPQRLSGLIIIGAIIHVNRIFLTRPRKNSAEVTIHRLDRQPKRNAQHKTGRCLSADLKDSCLVWSGSHDFLDLLENILILHGRGPDYCLKCEVVIS